MADWFVLIILVIIILASGVVVLFLAVNLYFSILTRNCPYIKTSPKTIDKILKEAELKEGQYFLELGCGDGRVLRRAARQYKIKGRGIDIHGWAVLKAKILARNKNIEFQKADIFKTDIGGADVVYLFLTRKILEKLAPKLKNEIRPGALLISHGFEIPEFEEYLFNMIEHGEGLPGFQRKTFFFKIKNPND